MIAKNATVRRHPRRHRRRCHYDHHGHIHNNSLQQYIQQ
jgi:hypothetical protein